MNFKKLYILILCLQISAVSIAQNKTTYFLYAGRIDQLENNNTVLIGTAASISFNFTGNDCTVKLQSIDSWEHHNYVVFVLDEVYLGKFRVEKGVVNEFPVKITSNKKVHNLTIYKATEATMGNVVFLGTTANLTPIIPKKGKRKKIEFIGDSITSGAANDPSEIPCDEGEYFDHHNGFFAYGPIMARDLDANYLLSSVSGIGIYRNWNDENIEEPIMPEVYENLYLTKANTKPYDFAFQPDIISIALGTNDFSNGDGEKKRLPFNAEKYVSNYINFIKMLYKHNPNTQIILMNSPMVNGQTAVTFDGCLNKVKGAFANDTIHKPILIFKFNPMTPKGCGGHPDMADHKVLANEYAVFLKKVLDEK